MGETTQEVTRGSIRASRTPGGNITIDTTHTAGGLIRSLGGRLHIEIERADLDDAIAALQALRTQASVTWPSPDYATIKKSPASGEFGHPPAARRPIERYVRAAVAIPGYAGHIDGTIEIGLHYGRGAVPHAYRNKLIELGEVAARVSRGRTLDEDTADLITNDLDERIVRLWGDRPRFIEVWRGTGDDAEPLTQVYAPHGMPIGGGR